HAAEEVHIGERLPDLGLRLEAPLEPVDGAQDRGLLEAALAHALDQQDERVGTGEAPVDRRVIDPDLLTRPELALLAHADSDARGEERRARDDERRAGEEPAPSRAGGNAPRGAEERVEPGMGGGLAIALAAARRGQAGADRRDDAELDCERGQDAEPREDTEGADARGAEGRQGAEGERGDHPRREHDGSNPGERPGDGLLDLAYALELLVEPLQHLYRMPRRHRQDEDRCGRVERIERDP